MEKELQRATAGARKLANTKLVSWSTDMVSYLRLADAFRNVTYTDHDEMIERLDLKITQPFTGTVASLAASQAETLMDKGVNELTDNDVLCIAGHMNTLLSASEKDVAAQSRALKALKDKPEELKAYTKLCDDYQFFLSLYVQYFENMLERLAVIYEKAYEEQMNENTYQEYIQKNHERVDSALARLSDQIQQSRQNLMKFAEDATSTNISERQNRLEQRREDLANTIDLNETKDHLNEAGERINSRLRSLIAKLPTLHQIQNQLGFKFKVDYTKIPEDDQHVLQVTAMMADVLYSALAQPLITLTGHTDRNAAEALEESYANQQAIIDSGEFYNGKAY